MERNGTQKILLLFLTFSVLLELLYWCSRLKETSTTVKVKAAAPINDILVIRSEKPVGTSTGADEVQGERTVSKPPLAVPTSHKFGMRGVVNETLVSTVSSSKSLSWPFRRFDDVADSKNRLVILIVNCGYLDFMDNALESMKAVGVSNVVVVPLDSNSYNYSSMILPANKVTPVPESFIGTVEGGAEPASKPIILEAFLNMGYTIFYHDLDVFWKRNIFEYFDKEDAAANSTLDMVAQSDIGDANSFSLGTCYLYIHPTHTAKEFLKSWKQHIDTGTYPSRDQDAAIRSAYKEFPPSRLNITVLAATNEYIPSLKGYNLTHDNKRSKIWMFHSDGIIGHDAKKDRFRKEWKAWTPSRTFESLEWKCDDLAAQTSTGADEVHVESTVNIVAFTKPPLAVPVNIQKGTQSPIVKTTIHNASDNTYTNKTLVLVVGNLRGGEKTWQSMYQHLLDLNHADLALMIGEVPNENKTSSMYQRAKYIWEVPEFEDWGDAIDLIGTPTKEQSHNGAFTWRNIANLTKGQHAFGGTKIDPAGSGAINYVLRYFATQEFEKLNLTSLYTRFVFTRSDQFYLCDHNLNDLRDDDDESYIWLPEGEDYHGFQDRHFVTSADLILPAMNIFPPMVLNPIRYETISWMTNPEQLTKLRWTEDGLAPKVRRFPRMMFLAAVPKVDTTRYSRSKAIVTSGPATGLGIKYALEWRFAQVTCQSNDTTDVPMK